MVINIYFDVGHGKTGEDTGTSGTYNGIPIYENEQTLIIARAARDMLVSLGYKVTMSREENVNCTKLIGSYSQPDSNMIASAQRCKAGDYELNVSIHINWSKNKKARGYQIIYKTGNGKKESSFSLAKEIAAELKSVIAEHSIYSRVNNGQDHYGALRLHNKTGVIVECAFMSNQDDVKLLLDNQTAIGRAIARGINDYCVNNLGYMPVLESEEEEDMVRRSVNINGVKYNAQIFKDRSVALTISKPVDKTTKALSGAMWWASVLDNSKEPLEYYIADSQGRAIKFEFTELIGVTKGERFTASNANTYLGAVTCKNIQAWYMARGTISHVVGVATARIEGYISDEMYAKLI